MPVRQLISQLALAVLAGIWLCGFAAQSRAADQKPVDDLDFGPPVIIEAPTLPPPEKINLSNQALATPAAGFFPILPFGAAEDLPPQLLPVATNHPLDSDHGKITRAVIVIHDLSRDAIGTAGMLTTLAGPHNQDTLIIAPQFLLESDIARFAEHLPNKGHDLTRWAWSSWADGGESTAWAPRKGISSFTAIDLLLVYLGDKKYFPDLKDIIITGYGAGGDFVQRYAAVGQALELLDPQITPVRFVAANPSSYLYFTPMRPNAGHPGFALPDKNKCPGYDDYKYGLDKLNPYARRLGANAIRLSYASRHIFYLIGEKAGMEDYFPDSSCAASLQGVDRVARARNYDDYLTTIFGEDVGKTQTFSIQPKAGDDPTALFSSGCGMSAVFGDGECAEFSTPTP